MILLTMPVFFPIIQAMHIDPIWFGVIVTLSVGMACLTPPVGMNCYVVNGILKGVGLPRVFKGTAPFLFAIVAAIVICTVFPELATWLPSVMKG